MPPAPGAPTNHRAVLQLVAGAVLISFSPVLVRLTSVEPTAIGFYRTLVGGLVLLVLVRVRGHRISGGRIGFTVLLLAGAMLAMDLAIWHRSIWYVGPGLATLLVHCQVFLLTLAGIFWFGERLHWQLVVAIPMAFAGLALILGGDWSHLSAEYQRGVLFGLLSAGFYAAYILCLRWARKFTAASPPTCDLAVVSLATALCMGLGSVVDDASLAVPTVTDAGVLLAYALIAQVIAWVMISGSLRHVPASRVGLILLLQPALAFVWDVLLFQRPVTAREVAGALVALIAIYLGSASRR